MWMTLINLFLGFYIVPAVWSYIATQKAHKHYYEASPTGEDIFLVFCPLMNIVAAVLNTWTVVSYLNKSKYDKNGERRKTLPEKFFRTEVKK